MAYVVVTEQDAAADEITRETLLALKGALDANAAVLKAGERVVATESIYVGAQQAVAQFPAIQIEPIQGEESRATIGGTNILRLTFRVFGYEIALGQSAQLAENLAQLSDRIQTVFRMNPTLDGFCRDARIGRVVFGRLRGGPRTANPVFAPHPILATQMDVIVEVETDRP